MSPSTLRARAAAFFIEPREPTTPPGDLVPLVRREPPPPPRLWPPAAPAWQAPSEPEAPPEAPFSPPGAPAWQARSEPEAPPEAAVSPLGLPAWHAPSNPGAPPEAVSPPSPPIGSAQRAAVLGRPAGAVPAAAALACELRVAHGSAAAVVATWVPGADRCPAPRGPGSPAAARVAARLTARGLAAAAHGRLAWLALDDHVVAASVAARRASAALDVPLVVALCGPRCDIVEALLGEQDLVVVVTADPHAPMARLAVAGCARPATARRPPHGVRRMLALAGLASRALESEPRR